MCDTGIEQSTRGRTYINGIEITPILYIREMREAEALYKEFNLQLSLFIETVVNHVLDRALANMPAAGLAIRLHFEIGVCNSSARAHRDMVMPH